MLNQPVLKFYEWSEGRKLSEQLSDITGISARSLRKPEWVPQSGSIEKAQQKSKQLVKDFVKDRMDNYKVEIDRWIAQHPNNVKSGALYSGLIYECQTGGVMAFPRTIEFAREIDELSSRLYESREANDLAGFKEALLASVFAAPIYFAQSSEEPGLAMPPMMNHFQSAKDWTEIDIPFQAIVRNTLFSLFAHWDVEFCSQYFSPYTAKSIFAMVLPRLDPAIGDFNVGDVLPKRRDMFWYPVRRLISLMGCMGSYCRKGRWPDSLPRIEQISQADPQHLVKWRNGTKRFIRNNFSVLWQELCPDRQSNNVPSHPAEPSAEPWPLFVATVFWQHLLVSVSPTSKEKSIWMIGDEYLSWWKRHYDDLTAKGVVFGAAPWPACFDKV